MCFVRISEQTATFALYKIIQRYNDTALYDTSAVVWYKLVIVNHNIIFLGYNNIRL
jgi:hypothetical protein